MLLDAWACREPREPGTWYQEACSWKRAGATFFLPLNTTLLRWHLHPGSTLGTPPKRCVPFYSSQSTWRQQLQPSWAPAPWPPESQVPWRVLGYLSHVDSNLQIPSIVELSVRHDAAGEVTQNIRTEGRDTTPLGVGIVECTVGHSMAPNWTECISCSMTKPPRTCAGIWGESKWRISHLSLVTSRVKVAPNLLSLWDPKSINPQAPDINSRAWLCHCQQPPLMHTPSVPALELMTQILSSERGEPWNHIREALCRVCL